MAEVPGFAITGIPRSKKNSQRVVNIGPMCRVCGKRGGFPKVLPSKAFEAWELAALRECMIVKPKLRAAGVELPIMGQIGIEALFYLPPTAAGLMRLDCPDLSNLFEAVGDMLQKAEIIGDDRQIEDWDNSRRLLDRERPRVEIFITVIGHAPPVQEKLYELPETI